MEQMTGLPEYRNDGLLVDYRLLKLNVYLDKIKQGVKDKLDCKLRLAQVLEGGTWTAGRRIAAKLRPKDGGPPTVIKIGYYYCKISTNDAAR
ncbi:hypothetical protein FB192DRAFT_1460685 [Mucor lusitanicus]|uniref:Uncharacterized protein n=2 Tax=Mucor circinelloides f. lusitanicus TaxID=29924 RepID=A0A168GDV8_MUCCL|nr:hypothetical protein FB192DRAFT_1460685 [Mucor lusitanicus]OAC97591.1 hypothetical protein MUCCIDRAFT_116322 [Mucor lusitanicus CBS 277.49]